MAMGNTFKDAVQAEPAQVVGHPADGVVGWVEAQQWRQKHAQLPIVEPTQWETEYHQHGEQGLHARIAKAQRRGPLPFYFDGTNHPVKRVFANPAVVRNLLDVQQTSVGSEADLPQRGQVLQ